MKHKLFFNKLWLRVGMLVAIMTTALSGTAWAETWTHAFASPEAISDNSITVDGATWNVSTVTKTGSPTIDKGNSYQKYCLTFGSGKNNCYSSITFSTDYFSNYNVQSVTIQVLHNASKSGTFTATQGNTTIGTITQTIGTSWTDLTVNTNEGSGGTLSFTYSPTDCAVNIHSITVTYTTGGGSPTPSISANDVNIEYSATNGSIAYTLSNATGNVTASVTEGDWLTLGTITSSAVPFTCSGNSGKTARTATVTLSYPDAPNKVVTVTQAGNPNVVDNISDITAAGTYTVKGTIVAKSQRGFIVGDGTGYVYYYNQNYTQSDYNIGDKVTLDGSVVVYGGVFEFNNSTTVTAATESNYVAEEPTVLTGSQMDTRVGSTTPAELSTYVQYEGVLTVDGTHYNITSIDGASTAKGSISYPISTDFTSLSGKTVKVTGYYVGVSSSTYYNTMLESIEEVVNTDPVITASDVNIAYDATSGEIAYTIANPTDATLTAALTNGDWISNVTVDAVNNKVTFTATANEGDADRTATITLSYTGAQDKVVTVTQGHYVADYATLPFSFDGGKAAIENTAGLTETGLGSDYSSAPLLKFDSTDDELILKINERPGVLTFDIKGNSFSGGTFKVQASSDGETFTDVATYTTLGDKETKTINNLAASVRYIKWVYTTKSSGNVALGNITLAKYVIPEYYTLSWTAGEHSELFVFDAEDDSEPLTSGVSVTEGATIYVSVGADEGYESSLTVKDADDSDVTLTEEGENYYSFTMPASNVTITATAVEYVAPVTASYVLATSITSGKHYVIASGKENGTVKVMGSQNENNRGAVDATIAEGVLSVSDEYEFTIESASVTDGETEVSGYAIYDESGYLYAASSSKNHLKTQETNNANGIWTITFDEESNVASVVAQGSNSRNNMRYNSSSTIFSCYSSGQQDIYLFEKVEAPAQSQSVTVTSACYATFVAEADLDIPEGVEVFAVTVNGAATSAHLEAIEDGIPEGEAVLVKASADTYEFPYATEAVAALTIDNDLKAATTAFNPSAANTIYCLAQKSGTVGFYPVATTVTIPAGKAYLETTSGEAPVKGFYGFDDDATGIEAIDHSPLTIEGAVYNLAGQRLQKMQKGINIVNGKKIAVK